MVDLGVFRPKTDPLLQGQTAQMPRGGLPSDGPSGPDAVVATIRGGLSLLTALPPVVIASTGARLQAAHPDDHAGLDANGTWPEELLALARPLYARGLSMHLLLFYGAWP